MPGRYDDEDDDTFASRLEKRAGAAESRSSEGRSDLGSLIDMLGRRISGALLFAGVAIGLGVYAGGSGDVEAQKYQAFATDGEVFRLNTESGTLIACNATQPCRIILQRGQDLDEDKSETLFKAPPAPQLPAPSSAPAPAATQPALPAPQPEQSTPPKQ